MGICMYGQIRLIGEELLFSRVQCPLYCLIYVLLCSVHLWIYLKVTSQCLSNATPILGSLKSAFVIPGRTPNSQFVDHHP